MEHQQPEEHEEEFYLDLHPRQWEVFACNARFRVLVAGRRFGKTHLALIELFIAARGRNKKVWYVGPTGDQSKFIAWDQLKTLTRPYWSRKPTEKPPCIYLEGGSSIHLKSGFKPGSLRGAGLDFLVIDEAATITPELWEKTLRPTLLDRQGRALIIGTPQGRNHLYDLFCRADSDSDWASFQFTTAQGGVVAEQELVSIARDLDPESYAQELEARFDSGLLHRVYHCFDRAEHVKPVFFSDELPLIWSIDFNVNPMCMLLMQQDGEIVNVLEEIVIRPSAHTELACKRFLERAEFYNNKTHYARRPLKIKIYGDSSGNQHRTSGAETDWAIVKQSFNTWVGTFVPKYYIPASNPAVRDRINCVNSRLRNQAGETRLFINPTCKELIRDLEEVSWSLDSTGAVTAELAKSDKNRTHASDALGYFIYPTFPLKSKIGYQPHGNILSV